jgi:lipoate-protein ligase B
MMEPMKSSALMIRRTSPQNPFLFSDLCQLQDEYLSKGESKIIFAEVEPVVTLGTRQLHGQDPRQQDIAAFTADLKTKGIEVVAGERGGNETWHGPGQWVCFPVMPLVDYVGDPKGVRKAVHQVLHRLLPVVKQYQPTAHFEDDTRLGLWSSVGKLVSIGIKIRQGPDKKPWITSGFAINCSRTPLSFVGINPCGIGAAIPDFLFNGMTPSRAEDEFKALPALLSAALMCPD